MCAEQLAYLFSLLHQTKPTSRVETEQSKTIITAAFAKLA